MIEIILSVYILVVVIHIQYIRKDYRAYQATAIIKACAKLLKIPVWLTPSQTKIIYRDVLQQVYSPDHTHDLQEFVIQKDFAVDPWDKFYKYNKPEMTVDEFACIAGKSFKDFVLDHPELIKKYKEGPNPRYEAERQSWVIKFWAKSI